MKASQIVTEILSGEPNFYFHTLLTQSSRHKGAAMKLNGLVEESPELSSTVLGLAMYPAYKWLDSLQELDIFTSDILDDERFMQLSKIQGMLHDVTGYKPEFKLAERERHYKCISKLVNLVENAIDAIKQYPKYGMEFYRMLHDIFIRYNEPTDTSGYIVKKYLKASIITIHERYGSDFKDVMQELFHKVEHSDNQLEYAFHNTELLLNEYTRIMWCGHTYDDKAVQLLGCGSVDDMLDITCSDEKYSEASHIVEFMKLIRTSIEYVRVFPKYGDRLYEILQRISDSKFSHLDDGSHAKQMDVSPASFSRRRRKAIRVLSFVLWGFDAEELLGIVMD